MGIAIAALWPVAAAAQQGELRLDSFHANGFSAWHVGAGLTWPAATYVRVSTVAGYGVGDGMGRSYRGELMGRFTLDPFRRRRVGFSLGGGLGVSREAYLLAVGELEGPVWRGITPALQAGVGGGFRVALIARRAVPGRR